MSTIGSGKGPERILKRANPSTIQDKFLVGYQGWFTCGGDGEPVGPGHHGWLHWFNFPIPGGGRPNTDVWPDVSTYSPSELFPAPGLHHKSGEQAFLFSSRHPKTVQRHFHWMAEHGIDGAFLQRFAGQCDLEAGNEGIRNIRDEVGQRVMEAAEKEGRVFAIMYDVSGVPADRIRRVLERDWIHLVRNQGILDSPNYLREKGKPVVALWGFGFEDSGHTPALVRAITTYIRNMTPGGAYIMAGTPAHWRTAEHDADRNKDFLDVWLNEFDAISPWTIGRYRTEQEADDFAETKMKGDMELIKRRNEEGRKIDYIPVIFPGGSGFNLSEGKWGFNDIKRNGGRFLWQQIVNAKRLGVRMMYGAMWDEYDEGTALMPIVTNKRLLPESDKFPFMALDEDGYDLPSDWYMRICGFAAEGLRSERRIHETFPSKELQDYWGSRPRYEDVDSTAGDFVSGSSKELEDGASVSGGQSYQEWLAAQRDEKDQAPPPPYTLEAEDVPATVPQPQAASTSAALQVSVSASAAANGASTPAAAHSSPPMMSGTSASTPSAASARPSGPPTVNTNSRPQQPYGERPSTTSHPQDPITSLTNEFDRYGISSQTQAADPGGPTDISPPPLHPAHPAASGLLSSHPGTSLQSHPQSSQSSRPYQSASAGPAPSSQQIQNEPDPWSQMAWPPPEWGVKPNSSQRPPTSTYPGQMISATGAQLQRPQTFTASSVAPPSKLKPHASISGSSIHYPQHSQPLTSHPSSSIYNSLDSYPYGSSVANDVRFPDAGPSSSNSMPPFSSSFDVSPYPPVSSYTPPPASQYPGQMSYAPSPLAGPGLVPLHVGSEPAYGTSTYPGQSSYTVLPSFPQQSYPYGSGATTNEHGVQFPQSGDYYNVPGGSQASTSLYSSSYSPNYIIPEPSGNPYHGSPAGGWRPGSSKPPGPPAIPPRPPTHPYTQSSSSGPSFPSAYSSTSSGPFGFALNAVDRIAGKKTREQLESSVGSFAQTGNKLFNKLTK